MVSKVSRAVDWTLDGAFAFCLHLLEDVNAHGEMVEVEKIFEKSLNS